MLLSTVPPGPLAGPAGLEPFRCSARLPAQAVSVRVARGMVAGLASTLGETRTQHLQLLMSEVVTNAVRHGSPAPQAVVRIELTVDDRGGVRAAVQDTGPQFDPPPSPTAEQVGGFGLHIVESLATSWQLERVDSGNRVLFSL